MEPTFEPPTATDYSPDLTAQTSEPLPAAAIGTASLIPAEIRDRITIAPVAPWIVERPVDYETKKEDSSNPAHLVDWQHHAGRQESYYRLVHRLDTMNAINQASQWRLNFDPATERITIHALIVRRGEQTVDNARPERLRVLQREEGFEFQILRGVLTIVVLLEDVRIGDVLDVSYTTHFQDRIFPDRFTQFLTIPNWTIRDFHFAVRFPSGRPMRWKSNDQGLAPAIREEADETEWSWHLDHLSSSEPEPNVPSWHFQNRWIQLTDFASWADVVSGTIAAWQEDWQNPEVLRLVESIAAETTTPALRAERALTYLQDEIRYLSDNTKLGGRIPTAPGAIIKRGFGDCKDKSFAAAHLLRLLGIPARPVLVNAELRQSVKELLPTPDAFNHAIVEYEIDGRRRWMDVTQPLQGGSILSRPTAPFKLGLPLGPGVEDLEPISSDDSNDRTELRETFYLDTSGRASSLRVQVKVTGREAEKWRRALAHNGVEFFERDRELFYQRFFSGLHRVGKLEWHDDRTNNEMILAEAFDLRDAVAPIHSGKAFLFSLRAHAIQAVLGFHESGRRRHPWELRFPCRVRHIIEIESSGLPPNLVRNGQVDGRAFRFSCHGQERPGSVSITYQVHVLTDHVPATDFEMHKQKVREAWPFTMVTGQLPSNSVVPWKARPQENLLPRRSAPGMPAPALRPASHAANDLPPTELAPALTSRAPQEQSTFAPRQEKSSRTNGSANGREQGRDNRPPPPPPIIPPPLPDFASHEHSHRKRRRGRKRRRSQEHSVLFWIVTILGSFLLLAMILFLTHRK